MLKCIYCYIKTKRTEGNMSTLLKVTLIIIAVLVVLFIVLYIVARKAEKKSAEQREAMESNAQTMSFYVIDKKKIKLKDANLPKIVTDQTPKYLRGAKMPILKVKVGPKVMSLICDEQVYNTILPKQEVKAQVSGIYVISAKRIRGPLPEPKKTKKELKAEKKAAEQAAKAKAEKKKSNK